MAGVRHEGASFEPHPRHAAVAIILAPGRDGIEVCFIRRAQRTGDPWSGQVAFPGGRASAVDPDPQAVAERETQEEIGLSLGVEHRLGALPMRLIENNTQRAGLTLWPFVYCVDALERAQASVRLPAEVASVFWVPIGHLFDAAAVTEYAYPVGANAATFPGIEFGEHVIWGLTLTVLASFAQVIQRGFPALA